MDREDIESLENLCNHIRAVRRRAVSKTGLQMVHYDILLWLVRQGRGGGTPLAVARGLGLTKGTVSQSIRWLAMNGYLDKRADEDDRRKQNLSLTAKSRMALATVEAGIAELLGSVEISATYAGVFRTIADDVLWQIQAKEPGLAARRKAS